MQKEYLEDLKRIDAKVKIFNTSYQCYIDWAIDMMLKDDDDYYICLLASSSERNTNEIDTYLVEILGEGFEQSEDVINEVAGSIIAELGNRYFNNTLSVIEAERVINQIDIKLNSPEWLVILSRNAEYATDIDYFLESFEVELKYVSGLWIENPTFEEFKNKYSRIISNLHMGV